MAKYILRFRAINKDIFLDIKSNKKIVETRAATEKYRNIKTDDMVVLVYSKERFEKVVKKAKIFKTIATLLKTYPLKRIMPKLNSKKEWRQELYIAC